MTEELAVAKKPVFAPPFAPERHFRTKNVPKHHYIASYKRHITHRWCSRLAARGLPGSDLAVEYLYGKYINNLSVSCIKESGRIILHFLGFLERQGTTVYCLTRQDISAYVQYEQDRGLTTTSVANHLRTSIYLRLYRQGDRLAFHYSEDGEYWHMVRHFTIEDLQNVRIGFSVQALTGEGCQVEFSEINYRVDELSDIRNGE